MSLDTATESDVDQSSQQQFRHRIELLGLSVTAIIAVFMLLFILIDWLRLSGLPRTGVAVNAFDWYIAAGAVLDTILGTRVFESPGTIRIIATSVLIGIVGPLVGVFLVHRQMALIGETLAHTAFAGVAVGVVIAGLTGLAGTQDELILIAFVVSAIAAIGLQQLTEHTDSYGDVPIAIVLTASFAIGTILISLFRGRVAIGIEIEDFLFGDASIVTIEGTRVVAILTILVVFLVILNYKQLVFITFDEQAARVARMNVQLYNLLLIVMTSVVVVGAMQILGVILVAGLLVIPSAAASQLAGSFRETLYLSVLFGQVSVIFGVFVALVGSIPTGGSIILVAVLFYIGAVIFSDRSLGQLTFQ